MMLTGVTLQKLPMTQQGQLLVSEQFQEQIRQQIT